MPDGVHSCTFASSRSVLNSIEVPAVSSLVLVRASLVDCRRGWSAPLSAALSTVLSAFPVTKIGDSLPSGSPLAPCTPVTGVETNESMLVGSIPPAWSTALFQGTV
jgi:hypothetical protein